MTNYIGTPPKPCYCLRVRLRYKGSCTPNERSIVKLADLSSVSDLNIISKVIDLISKLLTLVEKFN
ncbi:hypothetical protein BUE64_13725 [Corynebacterium diphtheriae subsp. lausannense]|uniref:Uncharacterized protein n=1 Tax=Corynebacterium belfantii TaxID=2014537 RepID=A0ABS0LFZ1_9CORY|nr:hypothetical protein [Corynebacterium belfantii]OLN14353.1 hypothetical protein BUE64_13725 [Corynebacterium diphtheriae subsp. lausannense]MBG9288174.1 hypothetical protein [Corynebacterium belfantii]MBG9311518.1 hypothetical protein [Corynebacterium belfantii]MBG9320477.1 hypothetical protein [Corynebacterium belfantii]